MRLISPTDFGTQMLSKLANFVPGASPDKWDLVRIPCWRPSRMKKFKMQGALAGFESKRLLEIDSQENIADISEGLIGFSEPYAGINAPVDRSRQAVAYCRELTIRQPERVDDDVACPERTNRAQGR